MKNIKYLAFIFHDPLKSLNENEGIEGIVSIHIKAMAL